MTDANKFSPNQVLIAIDIAKQSHDAVIAWPSGRTQAVKIANSLAGYERLIRCADTAPHSLCVAFEPISPTGFRRTEFDAFLCRHWPVRARGKCCSKPGISMTVKTRMSFCI